jgi:hypothetical protein
MGTYYDVVCPEHKEVLRLGKTDALYSELEYLAEIGELKKEEIRDFSKKFIILNPSIFKIIINERPKAKDYLQKHEDCKLYFIDSEYSEDFNSYEGFSRIQAFDIESSKDFSKRSELISLMPFLTEEDKRSIESSVDRMHLEERHKLVRKEIFAALRIIEKTLGHQWYEKALKNYVQQGDIPQPSFFNGTNNIKEKYSAWGSNITQYISKKNRSNLDTVYYINPQNQLLSDFLIGEYPEIYLKLCDFAYFISELWARTNVKIKIDDYVSQERRVEPSLEIFQRFFFELKQAYFWIKNGFRVEFIPKGKTGTPDFKIISPQGVTYIECKKKDVFTALEHRFQNSARSISHRLFDRMESLKVNYEIEIRTEKEISQSKADSIISVIFKVLGSGVKQFTQNLDNISIQGKKLSDYGTTQILRDIPSASKPPPLGTKFIFEHFIPLNKPFQIVSTAGCPNVEPFPPDTPIANFKRIIIHAAFIPNKVQTILNSIKDSTQLSLSGVGGSILAIETALSESEQEQALMKEIFDNLPAILKGMPYVSAIVLTTIRTTKDDNNQTIKIVTTPHIYTNPFASNKLPKDVEFAMKQGKCAYNISFFSRIWDSKLS